jgi:hypothetical protein
MRATPARPDLGRYAKRFDVPVAAGALGVTFLGVTTLLLDDGDTAVLTDGFFSRPSLLKVGFARLSPDRTRIHAAMPRVRGNRCTRERVGTAPRRRGHDPRRARR